jgi:anti-sigma B factor antagonist
MLFTISDDRSCLPHHLVRLTGDLDIATAPELRAHLLSLFEDGQLIVAVDLDQLEFMDSSGLGVLVGGLKRARTLDGQFALICSRERFLKVLRITGLDSVFPIYASVDSLLTG